MDASLNLFSPLNSDVKPRNESSARDPQLKDDSDFGNVLNRATERDSSKETVQTKKGPVQKREALNVGPKIAGKREVKVESGIDDKAGVVAQSFEHMAVSYPVSQIAKESLDEKTESDLKEKGLWEIPSLVMAQPSQSLALMKVATDEMGQVEGTALPMGLSSATVPSVTKPIAQFMASLESELGVKPDRLIQAFKELSQDGLRTTPKETMGVVVKKLGLNPQEEARATELFSKMLSELQTNRKQVITPALLVALVGAAALGAPKVDGTDESRLGKSSLKGRSQEGVTQTRNVLGDNPNSQLRDEKVREASQSNHLESHSAAPLASYLAETSDNQSEALDGDKVKAPQSGSRVTPQPSLQHSSRFSDLVSGQSNQDGSPLATLPTNQSNTGMDVSTQSPVQQDRMMTPATLISNSMTGQSSFANRAEVKDMGKGIKEDKLSIKNVEDSSSVSSQTSAPQLTAHDLTPAKADLSGAVVGGGAAASELKGGQDAKQEAIRSIVNQAQMLAQKGGGEIRMSLKPDHLGEIQLKVAMEGNRVNIQMTTERGEVKKLIEQSANDLRHGLAGHNLSMDKLDVSVGQRDTQGFSRGQPDFGAARDFANNFHQQQNNRREFTETLNSLRGGPQRTMSTLDRAAQAQRAMSTRSSVSGRLNVVA